MALCVGFLEVGSNKQGLCFCPSLRMDLSLLGPPRVCHAAEGQLTGQNWDIFPCGCLCWCLPWYSATFQTFQRLSLSPSILSHLCSDLHSSCHLWELQLGVLLKDSGPSSPLMFPAPQKLKLLGSIPTACPPFLPCMGLWC